MTSLPAYRARRTRATRAYLVSVTTASSVAWGALLVFEQYVLAPASAPSDTYVPLRRVEGLWPLLALAALCAIAAVAYAVHRRYGHEHAASKRATKVAFVAGFALTLATFYGVSLLVL